MRTRWSETALVELDDIFRYIFERSPSAASAVVKRIEGLSSLLAEFPEMGHLTDETNVRVLSVVRYPFLMFYAIDEAADEIVVLHVRHSAQDWPQL